MTSERPRLRLVRPLVATQEPPPEPAGEIGVLATMDRGDHTQWLRVGVAHVEAGMAGAPVLCVELGAIPVDRRLYIPVGDVLACCEARAAVDHALSSYLGLPRFVRYCDDLAIFDDDPEKLREALGKIEQITDRLRLRLHPIKTRLHRTTDPVAFLGFVLQRRSSGVRVRLRAENVRRMRLRMRRTRALFAAGAIELWEVSARVRAWLAHARHGQTRRLLEAELARLRFIKDEEP